MNKFIFFIVATLLVPSLSNANDGLQAGAGTADITPDIWPISLVGSFSPRGAESAHDPLHVRAIALKNGDGQAAIAIVDILGLSRELLQVAKDRAAQKTGWLPEQMLVAATHTHTAPNANAENPAGQAFREKLTTGITEALTQAIENLQPAAAGWGADSLPDEVRNRRWFLEPGTMPPNPFGELDKVKMNPNKNHIVKPAGPVDPEVAVLDIRLRNRNQPLALLANYALHYIGGTGGNVVSADYFGEFARIMPARLGTSKIADNFVAMLSNGTSGDINNIDFDGTRAPRAPFEQINLVAGKVADAAWRATKDLSYHADAPVAVVQRDVTLKRRIPTQEQIDWANDTLAVPESKTDALPKRATNYAGRVLNLARQNPEVDVLIQAVRIGDQAIVSLPFEVLVEIGLELKEKSPFKNTFVIELANGSYGYLPTPHQHDLGGYETWLGTCNVEKDSSEILTQNLLEMLEELHGQ
ncbi:MAG: neutral/alkaline non-lysosomal ceramidase N-terminal domain-containing protein [Verrucomicrobiota bacterium]